MVDQAMVFIIFSVEVDFALLDKIFNTICLALSNCIENRRLTLRVEKVWISTLLNEQLENIFEAFSGSIENGSLAIAVGMVSLTAMF